MGAGWGARPEALRFLCFPQGKRVDTNCCFPYTCAVVLRPFGLVVKGKSPSPGTKKDGTGKGERPKWGASPAKPRKPLRILQMQFTSG